MNIHDDAIRLLEGGVVKIDGNWFRVKKFTADYDDNTCMECDLDSLCGMHHTDICAECEVISKRKCCLELALKGRL